MQTFQAENSIKWDPAAVKFKVREQMEIVVAFLISPWTWPLQMCHMIYCPLVVIDGSHGKEIGSTLRGEEYGRAGLHFGGAPLCVCLLIFCVSFFEISFKLMISCHLNLSLLEGDE